MGLRMPTQSKLGAAATAMERKRVAAQRGDRVHEAKVMARVYRGVHAKRMAQMTRHAQVGGSTPSTAPPLLASPHRLSSELPRHRISISRSLRRTRARCGPSSASGLLFREYPQDLQQIFIPKVDAAKRQQIKDLQTAKADEVDSSQKRVSGLSVDLNETMCQMLKKRSKAAVKKKARVRNFPTGFRNALAEVGPFGTATTSLPLNTPYPIRLDTASLRRRGRK